MSDVAGDLAVVELTKAVGKDIGELANLGTVNKSSIVDSINEVINRIPVINPNDLNTRLNLIEARLSALESKP